MTPLRAHSSCVIGWPGNAAHRTRRVGKIPREMLAGDVAVIDRLDRAAVIFLDAAALLHPLDAGALEALLDVDRHVVVGVHAGRIVDRQRRLARGRIERDLAQRHAQVRRRLGHRENLARTGDRAGGDLRRGEIGFGQRLVHCELLGSLDKFWRSGRDAAGAGFGRSPRPFAGMTRIRFKGSPLTRSLSACRAPLGTPLI